MNIYSHDNKVSFFDTHLNTHLLNKLKDNFEPSTKAFLFKNIRNSVAYQHQFLKKVQEKLNEGTKVQEKRDEATIDLSTYVRPDHLIKKNMDWSERHTRKDKVTYLRVKLIGFRTKDEPGEMQWGLQVGPCLISFNSSGLVDCTKDTYLSTHEKLFAMPLLTSRESKVIFRLITNLTEYLISCNGCMTYSKEQFNQAHFIKYWAEYYGIWHKVPELAQQYLNQYCINQTVPNIIRASCELGHLIPNFEALCKKHRVEKEQLSEDAPITLRADDTANFQALFYDLVQLKPDSFKYMDELRETVELVRCMVMKQYGECTIPRIAYSQSSFHAQMYNWPEYNACLNALSERYASVETLGDDRPDDKSISLAWHF